MMLHETSDFEFRGRGLAFPPKLAKNGQLTLVEDEEDIRQSIQIILGTSFGERVMRPEFGSGLPKLVFETMSARTIGLARHRVEEALITWEPRIDNIGVDVRAEPQLGRLMIDIHYRIRSSNTFYNLVYPFYLLEGRES
jgi:uncharacterized protein